MPAESETEYTVVINGKPQGPYSLSQLAGMDIKSGTFIRRPGMDDYKEAQEFSELRALLGLKYHQTSPQYFASFDQRLLASVIDYFLLLLAFVLVILLVFVFVEQKEDSILKALMFLIFLPVAKLVYGSIAECGAKQGTAGKRLLNIKVTDLMGNRLSLGQSAGRNLAKILSVGTLFIGYLYSFLNKKQQCLHDLLANTLVIKDRLI
jgi:uncharacterized RDD family membrane protein YckC